jgi:Zn-dependent protease
MGRRRSPLNFSGPPPLRLFRLFGIQFTANWIWLLLFVLLIYVGFSTFRGLRMGFSQVELWSLAVIAAVLSVFSLYAHELAHALVARSYGIPVRTISLFLLGGMTDMTRESPTPRAEFTIAIAGPLCNLVLGVLGVLVNWIFGGIAPTVAVTGLWMATVNLPLAIFNLVPAFPLDGGRVLRGLLWFASEDMAWASTVSARVGQLGAAGLLFSGIWILFDGSNGAFGGLWLIMIAWFMYAGAASSQFAWAYQDSLRRLTVASVMDRDFGKVQAGVSVQKFAEEHLRESSSQQTASPSHAYAVYRDEYLVGLLSLRELGRIPPNTWSDTNIERAMLPIESAPAMEPSAPALGALHLILEEGVEHIAVMAEGRLLGLVTRNELAKATAAK